VDGEVGLLRRAAGHDIRAIVGRRGWWRSSPVEKGLRSQEGIRPQ